MITLDLLKKSPVTLVFFFDIFTYFSCCPCEQSGAYKVFGTK
jgi:hypothetical protein